MRGLARAVGVGSSIGVPFAVLVSFGAFAGLTLDRKLGTSPWLLLGGLLLGSAAAFLNLLRVLAHFQRREEDDDGGADGPRGGSNGR